MTNAEARFSKSLRPRKPEGSLGRTDQDVHLDSHTAPELWFCFLLKSYGLWTVFATLPHTINETLKWHSPQIILMQSFWWWQCIVYTAYTLPHAPPPESSVPLQSLAHLTELVLVGIKCWKGKFRNTLCLKLRSVGVAQPIAVSIPPPPPTHMPSDLTVPQDLLE